jgi:cobalt-zinc-cadmium efflux system membrane fusion protein
MTTILRFALLAGFSATILLGCTSSEEAQPAAEGEEPAGGAITLWTDSTELFMEHPALIVGQPDKFAVHLTDLTDFAPLRSGRITLRFVPRGGGEPLVVVQDSPRAPGIYGPAPQFTRPGVYDLTIEVMSPQARDVIQVPELTVYATAAEAPRESGAEPPGISFLKEQQWKTPGFRTAFATRGTVMESFQATAEVMPAAGRHAAVTAPIGGLIDAGGRASAPAPGQRVGRGTVLAVLRPTLGEGGASSYVAARRELREAQDEYDRAKRLFAAEAIPQRRVHEAEIRLDAAKEALAGLAAGGALNESGTIAIRAPIAGAIAERTISPGARVEPGAPLFTIVDASVVWLRVNVPAAQAALVGSGSGASFRLPGLDRVYQARRLVSIGSVIDPTSRTVPVIYEVNNPDGTIKVGSTATVDVHTNRRAEGVLIPTSAIIEEDGRPIAYAQPEGERFERRELVLGGSERGMTLVRSGISERERVVTGAPYQVRLASLSTAVPAHGHEH